MSFMPITSQQTKISTESYVEETYTWAEGERDSDSQPRSYNRDNLRIKIGILLKIMFRAFHLKKREYICKVENIVELFIFN